MLERRFWPNFAFVFLGLIVCLSIWQMSFVGLDLSTSVNPQYTNTPPYTLNTINSTYVYPMEYLPTSDYTTVMNLTNFKFKILNKCKSSPLLLVLVSTNPLNYHRRKSIRDTWGKSRDNLELFFILGDVNTRELQKELEAENKKHNDLIQGNFFDAYRNMTYKHVMAFKFAIYHCPQAKYILKTDDDVFVNMPTMMDFLTIELSPYGAKNLLMCKSLEHTQVKRTYRSKWRVSFREFKDKYYPPYCPGWALLYSPDVLFTLYRAVHKSDYFWIDDVLITGILCKKEHIQHTNINSLVLPYRTMRDIVDHGRPFTNINPKIFLYGPPDMQVAQIYSLWDYINGQNNSKYVLKDHR